jgi:cyanophycinase
MSSTEHSPQERTPARLVEEEVGGTTETPVASESDVLVVLPERVREFMVVDERPVPPPSPGPHRGWLIPIGGRMDDAGIIDRFVDLCGEERAHIVVVPTASDQPDTGAWYRALFERHGAGDVQVLRLQRRGDVIAAEQLALVEHATGVFFTGGNQLKLATSIIGTPLARLLHARFASGMHVAGTSAGAAFLSAHMIAFGAEGPLPMAGMVVTCGGLGLTTRFLIDQHFRERGRLGRLLTAVAYNPFVMGIGVDENTAVFIDPHDEIEVVGEGTATLVDPSSLDTSHILEAKPGAELELPGMAVRVLNAGERVSLAV